MMEYYKCDGIVSHGIVIVVVVVVVSKHIYIYIDDWFSLLAFGMVVLLRCLWIASNDSAMFGMDPRTSSSP